MSTTPVADLVARLPRGASTVRYGGRAWAVSVASYAGGRSLKLWAEELGGTAFVSANVYLGADGETFRPCEMPAAEVLAFLRGWEPGPGGPVLPAVPAAD
ncbi:peptide methionine sulfoxide reductase [Nocardioides sp. ChNu-153]|uniref:peptide methionine sulfoxide reductase n=1 Tax=Nocardioides sp. ChNu-153 TaxID=2779364 RepID=UPI002652E9F7|nr:peptide methionine sulfoxide reductase [Nocardioides sp. ChNu-153]MDN7120947.1 peptide methionine sulfoxide reductase [Nocardioides sp. ChNu-153]